MLGTSQANSNVRGDLMSQPTALRALPYLAAFALAACAGSGPAQIPPGSSSVALSSESSAAASCRGQATTTKFASAAEKLSDRRGMLCIPAFGGFSGKMAYPAAHPAVDATVTSSTSDYNTMIPKLGKGKPVFILQIVTSDATNFGATTLSGGGLESKTLAPGKSYDVYGEALFGGQAIIIVPLAACKATAVKATGGGVIADLGSRLENAKFTGGATIYLEVYPASNLSAC
jgi:hypothetical protein